MHLHIITLNYVQYFSFLYRSVLLEDVLKQKDMQFYTMPILLFLWARKFETTKNASKGPWNMLAELLHSTKVCLDDKTGFPNSDGCCSNLHFSGTCYREEYPRQTLGQWECNISWLALDSAARTNHESRERRGLSN